MRISGRRRGVAVAMLTMALVGSQAAMAERARDNGPAHRGERRGARKEATANAEQGEVEALLNRGGSPVEMCQELKARVNTRYETRKTKLTEWRDRVIARIREHISESANDNTNWEQLIKQVEQHFDKALKFIDKQHDETVTLLDRLIAKGDDLTREEVRSTLQPHREKQREQFQSFREKWHKEWQKLVEQFRRRRPPREKPAEE